MHIVTCMHSIAQTVSQRHDTVPLVSDSVLPDHAELGAGRLTIGNINGGLLIGMVSVARRYNRTCSQP